MPAPGPGGTQSSLASMVAWLTKPFRQQQNATGKPPRDIGQFAAHFRPPDSGGFAPGNPIMPTMRETARAEVLRPHATRA